MGRGHDRADRRTSVARARADSVALRRPGSTIYVAWTQSRSGYFTGDGSFDLGRDLGRDLFVDRPANVLLVKVTYWISR
ncbi:MAG: hypothetical protein DMD65_09240 [Gemmatimonadetes bacterium]|nr:MAG: hypothetical protein DMD65_09240 [Gemmatimonadota bacterium]